MTVETQPAQELPDPAEFGLTVLEESELSAELRDLVGQVRGLVEAAAHTEADAAELAAVGGLVAEATRRLGGRRREGGALLRLRDTDGWVRYNSLTSAVSGVINPAAPPLELVAEDGGVHGEVAMNGAYEGPPGCVHGGWIAALLDQAVGEATARAGAVAMTAKLDVDYRRPTPLHTPLRISGRVDAQQGRKLIVSGRIEANGKVTAEASGIMVRVWPPKQD